MEEGLTREEILAESVNKLGDLRDEMRTYTRSSLSFSRDIIKSIPGAGGTKKESGGAGAETENLHLDHAENIKKFVNIACEVLDTGDLLPIQDWEDNPLIRIGEEGLEADRYRAEEVSNWIEWWENLRSLKQIAWDEHSDDWKNEITEQGRPDWVELVDELSLNLEAWVTAWFEILDEILEELYLVRDKEVELAEAAEADIPPIVVQEPWALADGLYARVVSDWSGERYEYSTSEDFTREDMIKGSEKYAEFVRDQVRLAKTRGRSHKLDTENLGQLDDAGNYNKNLLPKYATSDQTVDDFAVLYFDDKDMENRKVVRRWIAGTTDEPSHFALCYGNGQPVEERGTYGWVLSKEGDFFLFEENADVRYRVTVRKGELQHDIPEDQLHGAVLTASYSNLGDLIAKAKQIDDVSEFKIVLRHSSHTRGEPVIGAGLCTAKRVKTPASDKDGNALYSYEPSTGKLTTITESELLEIQQKMRAEKEPFEYRQLFSSTVELDDFDNRSGHYKPYAENLENALDQLRKKRLIRATARASVLDAAADPLEGRKGDTEKTLLTAGGVSAIVEGAGEIVARGELLDRVDAGSHAAEVALDRRKIPSYVKKVRDPNTSKTQRIEAFRFCLMWHERESTKAWYKNALKKAEPITEKFCENWFNGKIAEPEWMNIAIILTPQEQSKFSSFVKRSTEIGTDTESLLVANKLAALARCLRGADSTDSEKLAAYKKLTGEYLVTTESRAGETLYGAEWARVLAGAQQMNEETAKDFCEHWLQSKLLVDTDPKILLSEKERLAVWREIDFDALPSSSNENPQEDTEALDESSTAQSNVLVSMDGYNPVDAPSAAEPPTPLRSGPERRKRFNAAKVDSGVARKIQRQKKEEGNKKFGRMLGKVHRPHLLNSSTSSLTESADDLSNSTDSLNESTDTLKSSTDSLNNSTDSLSNSE